MTATGGRPGRREARKAEKANPSMAKLQPWIDARRKHGLSHAHIQMARELGMNPKKFGKLDNHRQEPWKAPLPIFIESLYFKRFGKDRPDAVKTLEDVAAAQQAKKRTKKEEAERVTLTDIGVRLEIQRLESAAMYAVERDEPYVEETAERYYGETAELRGEPVL